MNKVNLFKFIFAFLLIIYLTLYFSSMTGYYEYQNYQKMTLTEEQISKFEKDVKEGKKVDVEDYIIKEKTDYNNKIADAGKKTSYVISNLMQTFLTKAFSFLADFITE